jgi:hypothetical protein
MVVSAFGYADTDLGVEIVRSWADTWIAAYWWQPGQGRVFATVPAGEVTVVVASDLAGRKPGIGDQK